MEKTEDEFKMGGKSLLIKAKVNLSAKVGFKVSGELKDQAIAEMAKPQESKSQE